MLHTYRKEQPASLYVKLIISLKFSKIVYFEIEINVIYFLLFLNWNNYYVLFTFHVTLPKMISQINIRNQIYWKIKIYRWSESNYNSFKVAYVVTCASNSSPMPASLITCDSGIKLSPCDVFIALLHSIPLATLADDFILTHPETRRISHWQVLWQMYPSASCIMQVIMNASYV